MHLSKNWDARVGVRSLMYLEILLITGGTTVCERFTDNAVVLAEILSWQYLYCSSEPAADGFEIIWNAHYNLILHGWDWKQNLF